jgi:hypothetical protein
VSTEDPDRNKGAKHASAAQDGAFISVRVLGADCQDLRADR